MARPTALEPGRCYFVVNYYDTALAYPKIHTLAYVRHEERAEGPLWLFREPVQASDGNMDSAADGRLTAFSADELHMVLDVRELLRELRVMAHDQPTPSAPVPATKGGSSTSDLGSQIADFVSRVDCVALLVRIRFTDDAFSLVRTVGHGLQLMFSLRPRREPEVEARVRAMFSNLRLSPTEDYLANNGRTRILIFPLHEDAAAITELSARILIDVYAIRSDDSLDYVRK